MNQINPPGNVELFVFEACTYDDDADRYVYDIHGHAYCTEEQTNRLYRLNEELKKVKTELAKIEEQNKLANDAGLWFAVAPTEGLVLKIGFIESQIEKPINPNHLRTLEYSYSKVELIEL